MPKASEIAAELRRIADALDKEPDTQLKQLWLHFYCDTKGQFFDAVRLLPHPLSKRYDDDGDQWDRIHVEYGRDSKDNSPVWAQASVRRSQVCRLVQAAQPAVYDCEPLLTQAEEASLVED